MCIIIIDEQLFILKFQMLIYIIFKRFLLDVSRRGRRETRAVDE